MGSDTELPLAKYVAETLRLEHGGDWLVEDYLTQHPAMAGLNASSVNTVRIWVLEASRAGSEVVTAYTRIGRGGMHVDNATSGGIVAPIDIATGTLGPAQDAFADRRLYRTHPDHGAPIEGVLVPHWSQVQELAKQALRLFPRLHFAGLDVAVGQDGPCILELNVCPDREAAAFTGCATRSLLDLPTPGANGRR
jgi:hypothetical protein